MHRARRPRVQRALAHLSRRPRHRTSAAVHGIRAVRLRATVGCAGPSTSHQMRAKAFAKIEQNPDRCVKTCLLQAVVRHRVGRAEDLDTRSSTDGPSTSVTAVHTLVKHVPQSFKWDCGLACIQMLLRTRGEDSASPTRGDLINLAKTFSLWTIDLAYMMHACGLPCVLHTVMEGVRQEYAAVPYYKDDLDEDRARVEKLFRGAKSTGVTVKTGSVSIDQLAEVMLQGKLAIILTDRRLLPVMNSKTKGLASMNRAAAAATQQRRQSRGVSGVSYKTRAVRPHHHHQQQQRRQHGNGNGNGSLRNLGQDAPDDQAMTTASSSSASSTTSYPGSSTATTGAPAADEEDRDRDQERQRQRRRLQQQQSQRHAWVSAKDLSIVSAELDGGFIGHYVVRRHNTHPSTSIHPALPYPPLPLPCPCPCPLFPPRPAASVAPSFLLLLLLSHLVAGWLLPPQILCGYDATTKEFDVCDPAAAGPSATSATLLARRAAAAGAGAGAAAPSSSSSSSSPAAGVGTIAIAGGSGTHTRCGSGSGSGLGMHPVPRYTLTEAQLETARKSFGTDEDILILKHRLLDNMEEQAGPGAAATRLPLPAGGGGGGGTA
jgi:hypothetical protein